MIIKSIQLSNFRNYEKLDISFDSETNIIYGDNAQGKTNILEAAYLSGTTKSHKGSKDKEMIRFGEDEAHIRTIVEKNDKEYRIDMHLRKNGAKGVAINKMPIKKASELFGILNIVFFSPEDLNIIKNGPAERRRFIDLELCQLDKIYLSNLSKYNKTLVQRNRLLKDIAYRPDLIDTLQVWDMQLLEYGRHVIKKRREFVNELNEIIQDIHSNISGADAQKAFTSYMGINPGGGSSYDNVEIGGGRITGTETGSSGNRDFALYHADQYAAPTQGSYSTVQSVDGSTWYKQYAQDTVEKTPYTSGSGKVAYNESIVQKLPPAPQRKERM